MKFLKLTALLLAILMICPVFAACSRKTAAMTNHGYTVTEDMYRYWMVNWKQYYVNHYSDVEDTADYWQAENADGQTNEEYLEEQIRTRICYYLVAQELFDKYRLKLDDEAREGITTDLNEQIEYYGSRTKFNEYLDKTYGIDVNILKDVYTWEARYTAVYDYLFDVEKGIMTASDREIDTYYQNSYARIKYVMFFKSVRYDYDENGKKKTDSSGHYKFVDLTDEEIKEKKALVDKILEDVSGGAEIDPYVEKYMPEFGYDVAKYPNGFYITADEYEVHTAAVTSAALDMQIGETRLVETDDCYFVVKKYELIDEAYNTADYIQFADIGRHVNSRKFVEYFDDLSKDVVIDTDVKTKYRLSEI